MAPDRRFQIKITRSDEVAIVVPAGALDMGSADVVRRTLESLLDSGQTRVVVDLDKVTHLDSTGVGELVRGMKRARKAGGDLRLCRLRAEASRIFKLTGLDQEMAVFPTRKEAIASWS